MGNDEADDVVGDLLANREKDRLELLGAHGASRRGDALVIR